MKTKSLFFIAILVLFGFGCQKKAAPEKVEEVETEQSSFEEEEEFEGIPVEEKVVDQAFAPEPGKKADPIGTPANYMDSRKKLREEIKEEYRGLLKGACSEDIKIICPDIIRNSDYISTCLVGSWAKVSKKCQAALNQAYQKREKVRVDVKKIKVQRVKDRRERVGKFRKGGGSFPAQGRGRTRGRGRGKGRGNGQGGQGGRGFQGGQGFQGSGSTQ